jgi:hypothetical protein
MEIYFATLTIATCLMADFSVYDLPSRAAIFWALSSGDLFILFGLTAESCMPVLISKL